MLYKNNFWSAVFLLAGTTIGAGIFGIPYVTAHVGYWRGLLWLLGLSGLTLLINLAYSLVILRSNQGKQSQLVGYASEYLGGGGRRVAIVILLFGQWGSILAYVIGIGNFLAVLFNLPGSEIIMSVMAFAVVSLATWFRVRMIATMEGWLTLGMILVVVLIAVNGLNFIDISNLNFLPTNLPWRTMLMPYGVIFGALGGSVIIPEMFRVLSANDNDKAGGLLVKAVILGTLIPIAVYLVFQLIVVGVSGRLTTPDAIQGLVAFLDVGIIRLGAVFGILAMFSSYLTLSYVLKDTFVDDFHYPLFRSWLLANVPPFIVFLAGLNSFIIALEFSGLWIGTLSMGLVLLMLYKSHRNMVNN